MSKNGETVSNRDKKGRFLPGKSGNLSGRPKTTKDIKEALGKLTPAALETYRKALEDPEVPWRDKIRVAQDILDRVLGKPQQSVSLDDIDSRIRITIGGGDEYAD